MSLAQVAWPFSPACTWKPAMSQSHPFEPILSWKLTILGRGVTVIPTRRSLCTSCVVSNCSTKWLLSVAHCLERNSVKCPLKLASSTWIVYLGASSGTVELLPAPSSSANWTVGLPTDNGHDSDQVFEFNGTQAIKVPDGMVSTSLKEPFTISVWMRHGPGAHEKETILCNSDKTGNVSRGQFHF